MYIPVSVAQNPGRDHDLNQGQNSSNSVSISITDNNAKGLTRSVGYARRSRLRFGIWVKCSRNRDSVLLA